jgi:hypothetical protein
LYRLLLPWERWKILNVAEITADSSVFVWVVDWYFKLAVLKRRRIEDLGPSEM